MLTQRSGGVRIILEQQESYLAMHIMYSATELPTDWILITLCKYIKEKEKKYVILFLNQFKNDYIKYISVYIEAIHKLKLSIDKRRQMEGSFIIFNRLVGSMPLKWSHYLAFSEPTFRTCSPCGEAKDWPWLFIWKNCLLNFCIKSLTFLIHNFFSIYGCAVRESQSSLSPQSPPITHTRSNSPDYWSPPPVTSHQAHYINALLPNSHCLVLNTPCWLTWPAYLLSTVSLFPCSAPRSPPLLSSRWSLWLKLRIESSQIRLSRNVFIPDSLRWTHCIAPSLP